MINSINDGTYVPFDWVCVMIFTRNYTKWLCIEGIVSESTTLYMLALDLAGVKNWFKLDTLKQPSL